MTARGHKPRVMKTKEGGIVPQDLPKSTKKQRARGTRTNAQGRREGTTPSGVRAVGRRRTGGTQAESVKRLRRLQQSTARGTFPTARGYDIDYGHTPPRAPRGIVNPEQATPRRAKKKTKKRSKRNGR
jgi:hypothetical protein